MKMIKKSWLQFDNFSVDEQKIMEKWNKIDVGDGTNNKDLNLCNLLENQEKLLQSISSSLKISPEELMMKIESSYTNSCVPDIVNVKVCKTSDDALVYLSSELEGGKKTVSVVKTRTNCHPVLITTKSDAYLDQIFIDNVLKPLITEKESMITLISDNTKESFNNLKAELDLFFNTRFITGKEYGSIVCGESIGRLFTLLEDFNLEELNEEQNTLICKIGYYKGIPVYSIKNYKSNDVLLFPYPASIVYLEKYVKDKHVESNFLGAINTMPNFKFNVYEEPSIILCILNLLYFKESEEVVDEKKQDQYSVSDVRFVNKNVIDKITINCEFIK